MKKVVVEHRDEIAQYQNELDEVMDLLGVDEEIREGYFSDEAVMRDLFDFLTTREQMTERLKSVDLPHISPVSPLIQVLREMRRMKSVQ